MSPLFHSILSAACLITVLSSFQITMRAQGCSDAGLCSLGNLKPSGSGNEEHPPNVLKVGASYGRADHAITILGAYIEYSRSLSDKFGVDIRATSISQRTQEISTLGLSDLTFNLSYNITQNLSAALGLKYPLSKANTTKDNLPLPMDYQSSLGTTDLLLGVAYSLDNLHFVAATQIPLSQNSNEFRPELHAPSSSLSTFQATQEFRRKADALIRVSYRHRVSKQIVLTPSILPIYHLANDEYRDIGGVRRVIEESQGLTFNVNAIVDYRFDDTQGLQFNFGMPLIARTSRPDGLTRKFLLNVEYSYSF